MRRMLTIPAPLLPNVWTAKAPISGLTIEQLRLKPTDPQGMSHADLLKLDEATRTRLRREQRWRIHSPRSPLAGPKHCRQVPVFPF